MIKNLQTGNAIRFGGTQYKKLLREQRDGKVKYFNKKDILLHSKRLKRTSGGSPSDNDDEDACPICFEPNPHMIYLALCGHRVCLACIADWCSKTGLPCGCPTCRGPIFGPKALFEVLKSNNWNDLTDEAERAYSLSSLRELRRGKTNPPSATEIERTKREMERNKKSLGHQIDQEQLRLQIRTNRRTQRESRSVRTNKHDEKLAEKMRLTTVAQSTAQKKKAQRGKQMARPITMRKIQSLFPEKMFPVEDFTLYGEFTMDVMIVTRNDMRDRRQIRNTLAKIVPNSTLVALENAGRLESTIDDLHTKLQAPNIGTEVAEMMKDTIRDHVDGNAVDLATSMSVIGMRPGVSQSDDISTWLAYMGLVPNSILKGLIVKPSAVPPSSSSRANVALAFEVTALVAMKNIQPNEMMRFERHRGRSGAVERIYSLIEFVGRPVNPETLTISVLTNYGDNAFCALFSEHPDLAKIPVEAIDPSKDYMAEGMVHTHDCDVTVNGRMVEQEIPLWRYYVSRETGAELCREQVPLKAMSYSTNKTQVREMLNKYISGVPGSTHVWYNPAPLP